MKPITSGRALRPRGQPLRRRRHMKTRKRLTWRSLLHAPVPQLALLAVMLCGLYTVATSRAFAITVVDVIGDQGLPVDQVRAACKCIGANIFLTRPEDIRARVARIPWISVRQVYARLPNRVVIDAQYRHPVALWRTTVATYTVDLDGTVLYDVRTPPAPSATVPTTATAPVIFSPRQALLTPGQKVDALYGGIPVQMAVATRDELSPDIAPTVDKYHWSPYSGLAAHSRLGWWFFLGINLHGELRQRLDALVAAQHQGALKNCNYIDLQQLPYAYCRSDPQWDRPWGPGS